MPPPLQLVRPYAVPESMASDQDEYSLVTTLETMLETARQGRMKGLMYVTRVGDADHGIHVVGSYRDNPCECLGVLESLAPEVARLFKKHLPPHG